jgi:hypothetical protein
MKIEKYNILVCHNSRDVAKSHTYSHLGIPGFVERCTDEDCFGVAIRNPIRTCSGQVNRNYYSGRSIIPKVIVRPPRPFFPVTGQSPWTQNSPNLFWKPREMGLGTITSCPSRLSQKSSPYWSGCRVALTLSRQVTLLGIDKNPSVPLSKALSFCVGGVLSFPRMTGVTVLFEERTTMLVGDTISVRNKSLGTADVRVGRNSETLPLSKMRSRTETWLSTVVEVEKTKSPFETRISSTGSPTR